MRSLIIGQIPKIAMKDLSIIIIIIIDTHAFIKKIIIIIDTHAPAPQLTRCLPSLKKFQVWHRHHPESIFTIPIIHGPKGEKEKTHSKSWPNIFVLSHFHFSWLGFSFPKAWLTPELRFLPQFAVNPLFLLHATCHVSKFLTFSTQKKPLFPFHVSIHQTRKI